MENLELVHKIAQHVEEGEVRKAAALIKELPPQDIAGFFEDCNQTKTAILFRLLPKELAAETFVEMDADMQEALIKGLSDSELGGIFNELFLDDAVDIVEEMPASVVMRILRSSAPEMRKGINELLKYPSDSAGSVMTPEFIRLSESMTVSDAFDAIKKTGVDKETVYTCYVTKPDRKIAGVVTVKDMLLAELDSVIGDLMETNIVFAKTTDDREEVARMFDEYDFLAIPVVDNEMRLVGIITVDDAMDVLEEENTEDIEKMAAIVTSDKPYMKTDIWSLWKNRIPWLLLLMLSATFTGFIITGFEDALAASVVLTAFIPMLMGTGGNAGSQASVTVIRALSIGDIEIRDIGKVIWKEFRVSLLCGVTLAAASFAKLLLIDNVLVGNAEVTVTVSAVVALTVFFEIVIAKIVGCALPILAKLAKLDPAVMASPFITTIVDALSLLIYFSVARMLIAGLV